MNTQIGRMLGSVSVAVLALHFSGSNILAVDTMADWTGQNTNAANTTFTVVTINNNYGLTSSTSVGGTVQSKINFHSPADPTVTNVNEHHVYFSDPTLDEMLDFTTPLHMEGTITFNSPTATEPNFCFCWYAASATDHRIGLGISNLTATQNPPDGAVADRLRIDFGYATNPPSGSNRFYYVTADGTDDQTNLNSVIPNGSYPFTFDYTPGPMGMAGGTINATIGNYFNTVQPLENEPWDNDFVTFDRFGIVQRSTGSTTQNPTNTYTVEFSNVTYTGGTEFQPPAVEADYNGNGKVDAADYVLWRDGGPLINEVHDPGNVTAEDYTDWRARFGNPAGSGSGLAARAVAEPITALLAVSASVATVAAWRCRPSPISTIPYGSGRSLPETSRPRSRDTFAMSWASPSRRMARRSRPAAMTAS